MVIGVPKEIKEGEHRVALLPEGVETLLRMGHRVVVQQEAGSGAGFSDNHYRQAGASLVSTAAEVFAEADLIVKVKEPQPEEIQHLRPGHILFTFLHLAADRALTEGLLRSGVIALAYETLSENDGRLPLLIPMSDIAGRLSVQQGARFLETSSGGRGILLGGTPGVERGRVLVIGAGTVGTSAARVAAALGAEVVLLDIDPARLRSAAELFPPNVTPLFSTRQAIREQLRLADLVIGAVLIPAARAPQVIEREDLALMKPGAVIVDVAIDQGGCVATSRPTTHLQPTYVVDGIIHYCVTNMPGAVARTSSLALAQVTFPWIARLVSLGLERSTQEFTPLARAVNIYLGELTCRPVADYFGLPYSNRFGK